MSTSIFFFYSLLEQKQNIHFLIFLPYEWIPSKCEFSISFWILSQKVGGKLLNVVWDDYQLLWYNHHGHKINRRFLMAIIRLCKRYLCWITISKQFWIKFLHLIKTQNSIKLKIFFTSCDTGRLKFTILSVSLLWISIISFWSFK